MNKTAYQYYKLSRLLEEQSRCAHALELNYNASTFDNVWAFEEITRFKTLLTEVEKLEKELEFIDTSIPFKS